MTNAAYMKAWKRQHKHYARDWMRRYRQGGARSGGAAWKRIVRLFLGDF